MTILRGQEEPFQPQHFCYVLLRGDWIHPIAYERHRLLWYPEGSLNLLEQYQYRPYQQSIVTECNWLIALYDRSRVLVVGEDGRWEHPRIQTYAASCTMIFRHILGLPSEVPCCPLDGGRSFKKDIESYHERIKLANQEVT